VTSRFIPLAVPNIGPLEEARVTEAVRSGWVSTVGPDVTAFERRIAEVSGVADCAAVAAGTMGLHMALRVLGVRPGDLVIIPAYSFIATANAVAHAGAQPYMIDVAADSWTMDPEALRRALVNDCAVDADGTVRLRATGQRIAAVMPVYTNGHPADMDAINAVARPLGLPVIADAAASIGALYNGRPLGGEADLTSFSFNGNKTMTTGGGGAVVGPDAALVARVRHISTTARVGTDYEHDEVGFNYRLTNLEAALGLAQLDRLETFHVAKQKVADAYAGGLSDLEGVTMFPSPAWASRSVWFTGIVLDDRSAMQVPQLIKALNDDGIGVRSFWKPLHMQRPYADCPRAALPVTEQVWPRALPLPCSTNLADDDIDYVIARVRAHLGGGALA
jgi:dTDP-4-amino-4,6-dideoxygalactose transaminase